MPSYQPTSRRPIADIFRLTANAATRWCVAWRVHPDTISYASLVAAIGAAMCFWQSRDWPALLFIAPLFGYVRLWCNMLDGMVALASGQASHRGEILNDLPDRVSDVIIFVGAAHSGFMQPLLGYWAAIFALLTAYVGTLGQAVGVHRDFRGIMSKPWRMVMLHVGAWVTLAMMWWNAGGVRLGGLTPLDWACAIVIVGCVETIARRLRNIFTALRAKSARG